MACQQEPSIRYCRTDRRRTDLNDERASFLAGAHGNLRTPQRLFDGSYCIINSRARTAHNVG